MPEETDDDTRLFRAGHAAVDLLGAATWEVLDQDVGRLRLRAHVPDHVRNPRRQLFGGFTATYIDLVALATVYAGHHGPRSWMATANLHVDYLAPIVGDAVIIEGSVVSTRGRTRVVEIQMFDGADEPAVLAVTTLRMIPS